MIESCHVGTRLRSRFLLWAKDEECDQGSHKANADKSSNHHTPNRSRANCRFINDNRSRGGSTAAAASGGRRRGSRCRDLGAWREWSWWFSARHPVSKAHIESVTNLWKCLSDDFCNTPSIERIPKHPDTHRLAPWLQVGLEMDSWRNNDYEQPTEGAWRFTPWG